MARMRGPALLLENHHTGERLAISRIRNGNDVWFALDGHLPPHREGPPLHIHFVEDEEGRVTAGTLSVLLDGRKLTVRGREVTPARVAPTHSTRRQRSRSSTSASCRAR